MKILGKGSRLNAPSTEMGTDLRHGVGRVTLNGVSHYGARRLGS